MADRNLNIRVAFSALNNMSRPVNAARQSAAALASQINQTKTSIKGLERQATSFDRLTAANKKTTEQLAQAKEQARQMAAAYGPLRQRSAEQVAALNLHGTGCAASPSAGDGAWMGVLMLLAAGLGMARRCTTTKRRGKCVQ